MTTAELNSLKPGARVEILEPYLPWDSYRGPATVVETDATDALVEVGAARTRVWFHAQRVDLPREKGRTA